MTELSSKNFVLFVHLGEGKVNHLLPNMERIRHQLRGTETQVILAATNEKLMKIANSKNFLTFQYITDTSIEKIFASHNNEHDHAFREGFWRYSLERLFAILQIHEKFPESRILHIESDILTLPDFPFQTVFQLRNTTWCKFNDSTDVGALIYFPSVEKSRIFKQDLVELLESNSQFTDMSALNSIADSRREIEYFPIAQTPSSTYLELSNLKEASAKRVTQLFESFQGIFDPAPIGMYFLGQDPRNNWGFIKTKIELPHSGINVSRIDLRINQSGELVTSTGVKVYCLHVHCKDIKVFSEAGDKHLRKLLEKFSSTTKKSKFSTIAFLDLLRDYTKRKKLIRLILNLPKIKSFRMMQSIVTLEKFFKRKLES